MIQSLAIVRTGLEGEQTKMDVIANNLANLNTAGFKAIRPVFQDLLYQTERRVGATSSDTGNIVPVGVQIRVGCDRM